MKREDIMGIVGQTENICRDNINRIIAKELGIEKIHSSSNLWCKIRDIYYVFDYIVLVISSETFDYKLTSYGKENIEYKFLKEYKNEKKYSNNKEIYDQIEISDIESNFADIIDLVKKTNNVLKAIVKCRKQILAEMDSLLNYEYNLKEI